MRIRRQGDRNIHNDSFSFRVKLTAVDVKKPLQNWLKMELDNDCYTLHTEEEIRAYFSENVFGYIIPHFARIIAEWAFWIGMREGYICRSQHDLDSPIPRFYIPLAILDVKCGPKLNISEEYKAIMETSGGSSALFEEQKPITKLEIRKD